MLLAYTVQSCLRQTLEESKKVGRCDFITKTASIGRLCRGLCRETCPTCYSSSVESCVLSSTSVSLYDGRQFRQECAEYVAADQVRDSVQCSCDVIRFICLDIAFP